MKRLFGFLKEVIIATLEFKNIQQIISYIDDKITIILSFFS